MSNYFNRQIYLPLDVILAIKLYCARQGQKTGQTYRLLDFMLDVCDFIQHEAISEYVDSYSKLEEKISAFNVRFPMEYKKLFERCHKKAIQEQADVSERSMLTTGVLLYLKRRKVILADKIKGRRF